MTGEPTYTLIEDYYSRDLNDEIFNVKVYNDVNFGATHLASTTLDAWMRDMWPKRSEARYEALAGIVLDLWRGMPRNESALAPFLRDLLIYQWWEPNQVILAAEAFAGVYPVVWRRVARTLGVNNGDRDDYYEMIDYSKRHACAFRNCIAAMASDLDQIINKEPEHPRFKRKAATISNKGFAVTHPLQLDWDHLKVIYGSTLV